MHDDDPLAGLDGQLGHDVPPRDPRSNMLGATLVLDPRGKVTGHTRTDAGEVRGILVAFPDGEMPYGLATRGEYWRVLP